MNENIFESNRAAWNQALEYHQKARKEHLLEAFQDPNFTVYGGAYYGDILTKKIEDIGLEGKVIAHIQCHNGRELLSFVNSEVKEAIGFDISDIAISDAEEFAKISKKNVQFIRTNILEIDNKYNDYFDFIFISEGALQWFPDLNEYFSVLSKLLKKGGCLLISELHPFYYLFENKSGDEKEWGDELLSYFEKGPYNYREGLDYMGGKIYDSKEMFWFMHNMSYIITNIIKNGIEILSFDEYNLVNNDHEYEKVNGKLPTGYLMAGVKK